MTEIKRLIVPLVQCKMEADATGDRGTFSGYASVWESIDLGGDTIRKGAFSNSSESVEQERLIASIALVPRYGISHWRLA
jgi:phage head maturation protease